jgi:hypothetical protein
MRPMLRGPTPWAVILCRFNDVAPPDVPRSRFYEMVSEYGRNGLFDYWKDISYETVSLAGSEVFGWYTMKYSFVLDSGDPFHDPNAHIPFRRAYIDEARRLAAADNVDLSPYHGLIVVINGASDEGNLGADVLTVVGGKWGQDNWRWCNKCQGLAYAGNPSRGPCPAGGNHDHSGSSNYNLSLNDPSFPGQDNWRWCNKCQGLAYAGNPTTGACPAGGVHDHTGSGQYRLGMGAVSYAVQQKNWRWCNKCQGLAYAGNPTTGACPAGGVHDHTGSADYAPPRFDYGIDLMFLAHETGHGYALEHSWSANPDREYGDMWDIMSARNARGFSNPPFGPSGPRLNAPKLHKMGWLPEDRVETHFASSLVGGQTVRLAALERPEVNGSLMARVVANDRVFTVEFRQPLGWDQGIGGDMVLIHELRSHYTVGQNNWLWCNKCQSLFYAGWAACPAGGLHDHHISGNYRLDLSPGASGQSNWRWCRKCQQIAFAGHASPGPCAAGGEHDHTGSGDYRLPVGAVGGQENWRWCNKCEALTFGGNATTGACPAGGSHNHSGSGNYVIRSDEAAPGQADWRWCRKCQGMSFAGFAPCAAGGAHEWWQSGDYAIASSSLNIRDGQPNWRWCRKCQQLTYAGNPSSGACSGGGTHDHTGSGDYMLPYDASGMNGQAGWRWCNKCQTLGYALNTSPGACAAGGMHDYSQSGQYVVANFNTDLSYLLGANRHVHDTFDDPVRNVHISIDTINTTGGTATITLGELLGLSPHVPEVLHSFADRQ